MFLVCLFQIKKFGFFDFFLLFSYPLLSVSIKIMIISFAFCLVPMREEAGFGSGPVFPASGGAGVFAWFGLEHIVMGNPAATL